MTGSGDNHATPESLKARPEQQWGEDGLGDPAEADFGAPLPVSHSSYLGTNLEHKVDSDPHPPAVVPVD